MLSGNELVAEGLGLFLEVLEAVGLAGGGGFEGFGFVVGLAAGDHAVEDAGEFVGGGDDAFGFAEPATTLLVEQARGLGGAAWVGMGMVSSG